MSNRTLSSNGKLPTVSVNLAPDAADDGKALVYSDATKSYGPGYAASTLPVAPATLDLTFTGNTKTIASTGVKATAIQVSSTARLITIEFPATASNGNLDTNPINMTTAALNDASLFPLQQVDTIVLLTSAAKDIPVKMTIGTDGVFTLGGAGTGTAAVYSLGFTVTYLGKPAA